MSTSPNPLTVAGAQRRRTGIGIWRDAVVVALLTGGYFALAATFEINERISAWTRRLEFLQIDELPATLLVLSIAMTWFAWRRLREANVEMLARQKAIAELHQARARLVEVSEENRQLARQAIDMQELERRGIARELHDELGQYFHAIRMELGSMPGQIRSNPELSLATVQRIESYIEHVYGVTRRIMNRLRPVGLDEIGLDAALQHLVAGWRERRPDIRFSFEAGSGLTTLAEAESIALFRIAQEAVTNAARHAAAAAITVRLDTAGAPPQTELVVTDNGQGLPDRARRGMGLIGMRERIEGVGGELRIESNPGRGTSVRARTSAAAVAPEQMPGRPQQRTPDRSDEDGSDRSTGREIETSVSR
jgi:two-component system, NarL family, sensor histidine kinase UhpB